MKKAHRPTKRPDESKQATVKRILVAEIKAAFKKCKTTRAEWLAVARWTEQEYLLLAEWFCFPETINPEKVPQSTSEFKIAKHIQEQYKAEKTARAVMFARIFSEAPDLLIAAIPRVCKRYSAKSALKAVVFNQSIVAELFPDSSQQFWDETADNLALKFQNKLNRSAISPCAA